VAALLGFTVFGVSSMRLSFVNLDIGPLTLLAPIVESGFGISFLFVPIGNTGTATVRNEEMGNATAIFNLLRNIGGSIGISVAQTELVRRACFHQTQPAAAVPQTGYCFSNTPAGWGNTWGAIVVQPPATHSRWHRCIVLSNNRHCSGPSSTSFGGLRRLPCPRQRSHGCFTRRRFRGGIARLFGSGMRVLHRRGLRRVPISGGGVNVPRITERRRCKG
jgi:hypothetical protein